MRRRVHGGAGEKQMADSEPGGAVQDAASAEGRRRVVPVHPLFIAAFPVLALYASNLGELNLAQIVRPLLVALVVTVGLWALVGGLTRSVLKGALCASAAVLAFFSYGHIVRLSPAPLQPLAMPLCIGAVALVGVWSVRTRGDLRQATAIVNLASLVLVAPSCWDIGVYQVQTWRMQAGSEPAVGATALPALPGRRAHVEPAAAHVQRPRTPAPPPARADLPDIYYIILDAYARQDSLRTFYAFDNEPFLRALEARGFYIARQSRSNYDETPLSLACSLNMKYLDDSVRAAAVAPNDTEPLRRMVDENRIAALLRPLGYHYVFISSGASQTRNETADLELGEGEGVSGFEEQVIGISALGASSHTRASQHEQHRAGVRAGFGYLETVARLRYPKFVFAHIMAPHPPFVFGADGSAVNDDRPFSYDDGSMLLGSITRDEYRAGYTAQLAYVNRRTLAAVDAILRLSKRRPIIIIQGDHGSRMNMDWTSLERTDLREPFSILNAYLVPSRVRRGLYPTISPVNSFRVVLSREFGWSLPLLPDRTFYSTAAEPYAFTEVTRLIPDMASGKPGPVSHAAGRAGVGPGEPHAPGPGNGRSPGVAAHALRQGDHARRSTEPGRSAGAPTRTSSSW